MKLDVLNIEGKSTGRSVELPDSVFGATPNDHLIYLAVKQYRAAQHTGNHKVKTRAEVKGSSKKLHRQKGTGGSRKGNLRNPLYKGGGVIFGPQPHSYNFKMNRKEKGIALISALSHKAKSGNISVVETAEFEAPKTKKAVEMMGNLEMSNKKVLFVLGGNLDINFFLSTRNIQKLNVCNINHFNVYDIVNANEIIFSEEAAKIFTQEEETETAEA